jgi:hypothetical protein
VSVPAGVVGLVAARQHAHRCRQLHDDTAAGSDDRDTPTDGTAKWSSANIIFFVALAVGKEGRRVVGGGGAARQVLASTDDFGTIFLLWKSGSWRVSVGVVSGRNETTNTVKVPRSQVPHSLTPAARHVNRLWCGWRRSGRESADRGSTTHTEPIQRVVRRQTSHRVRALRIAAIQTDCWDAVEERSRSHISLRRRSRRRRFDGVGCGGSRFCFGVTVRSRDLYR